MQKLKCLNVITAIWFSDPYNGTYLYKHESGSQFADVLHCHVSEKAHGGQSHCLTARFVSSVNADVVKKKHRGGGWTRSPGAQATEAHRLAQHWES